MRRHAQPLTSNAPKGLQTRGVILDAAVAMARRMGLEGLSIGAVADLCGMSKSGVFAHFGSREDLQISVIHHYHAQFERDVFFPALKEDKGLPRFLRMFWLWLKTVTQEVHEGCIYISGAVEFDDRPCEVRDALERLVLDWHGALIRALSLSVDEGHLKRGTDTAQVLFDVHGLVLVLHHDARFLKNAGAQERTLGSFERVMRPHLTASGEQVLEKFFEQTPKTRFTQAA